MKNAARTLLLFGLTCAIGGCSAPPSSDGGGVGVAESALVCSSGDPHLNYRNGKIITNPRVALVWWGASGYNGTTKSYLPWFYRDLLQGAWWDTLAEYGVNRGSLIGEYTIPASPGSSPGEVNYQLQQAMWQGLVPYPDDNTVYVVVFPIAYQSQLCTSCGGCGARGSYNDGSGHQIRFATVADNAAGFDAVTVDASGLTAALVVNPDSSGYANALGYDLDAVCHRNVYSYQTFDYARTYKVSSIYSNLAGQCVAAPIRPNCSLFSGGCTNVGVDVRGGGTSAQIDVQTRYTFDSVTLRASGLPSGVTGTFANNPVPWNQSGYFTIAAGPYATSADTEVVVSAYAPNGAYLGQTRAALLVESLEVLTPWQSVTEGGSASYTVKNGWTVPQTLAAGAAGDGFTYSFSVNPVPARGTTTLTVTAVSAEPMTQQFRVYTTDGQSFTYSGITVSCPSGLLWCAGVRQCLGSCPPLCGDGRCESAECGSCPDDCTGASVCGGGTVCPTGRYDCCGDGVCRSATLCRRIGC